ncbi:MAG: alkaline phosphatase family protein [Selenomonadales bacterium]|nr:alkaline phosphatase family protein [Selenomonadales bacterium]
MTRRLVVVSVDALSIDNWSQVESLPTFRSLIENGASSRELYSVFPTLTYAVHATIVTGMYPKNHGILHNHPLQPFVPEKEKQWYWYRRELRAQPIYDVARIHGLTTAAFLWPTTGKANIDYNLPEIVALKGENQALKVLRNGSFLYCLELELRYRHVRKGIGQPYLDDFTTACAVHTLKARRPHLTLIHLIDLDDRKHYFGTKSQEAQAALERMDRRLAEIIAATKEAGTYADTTFLVLGDHGQLDVDTRVRPNLLLSAAGLQMGEGTGTNWRAYLQCNGGSAYLYVRDGDAEARDQAISALEVACAAGAWGIERVYTGDSLAALCVGGGIAAVIEAKRGVTFEEAFAEPSVASIAPAQGKYANHGYSLSKPNYTCVFVAAGKGVARRGDIGEMRMVDIAPTMAKILRLPFPSCDGQAMAGFGDNE